jgi:hypothetical protein
MKKLPFRYASLVLLLIIMTLSHAHAQKSFKICRGENAEKCGNVDAFIGCTDPTSFAQNACPAATGINSIVLKSTAPGNRCGYSHYDVTCNPEIAPSSVLKTIGATIGIGFAIVSLASVFWTLGARSREAPAGNGAETTTVRSDPSNIARWISIIGGVLGLMISGIAVYYQFNQATTPQKLGLLDWIFVPAFAQASDGIRPESWFRLYIASGVLLLMAMAFAVALITLMRLEDTKVNQTRIKAADNIVKMFGGFFTGLATTLLTKL